MCYPYGFKRFAHRADLVRLNEYSVDLFAPHSFFDVRGVRDGKIVADDEYLSAEFFCQERKIFCRVFSKRILDAVHREACNKFFVRF